MANGTLPPELFAEQQALNRQQQMAQLLMQQGQQQPQGQMVSGRYVAPSFFQNVLPLAQMYAGSRMAERGDKQALELAAKLRGQQQKMGEDYFNAISPQQTELAGPTPTGAPLTTINQPDFRKAFSIATDPYAPSWLKTQAAEMLKPQKVSADETILQFNPATGQREIIAQGAPKLGQDLRDIARQAKLDVRNVDNWSDQDWQKVRNIEQQINESKRTVVNMPSEGERKAGFMANILDKNILQMQTALGVDPTAVKPNVPASIVSAIAGENVLSRSITPAQRQIVEDSQLDVLDAALTLRTGAAYTREQLLGMRGTYFPRIGDSPETVKAKQGRLETLLSSAYIAAGRATPNRVSATPPATPPAPAGKNPPAPAGVDQRTWNAMTPQERALFK
jgi:hypothetical protein